MKAHILTPKGVLFEGDVTGIQIPGAKGSFEVRQKHAPFVSLIGIGKMIVKSKGAEEKIYAVSGGFTEIKDNSVIVMAEDAVEAENINLDLELEKSREFGDELKKKPVYTDEYKRIDAELRKINNRINIARVV